MSHDAMCWAVRQPKRFKDMKPSEQVVLYVLADCHNPSLGCYPGQDYIISATNLSERAVRDQLKSLGERGLISWDETRAEGRRKKIRYCLAFERDFRPAGFAGQVAGGDVAAIPANSAGQIGDVRPADFDSSTGKFRHGDRQILPDYKDEPVREPVIEPLREARASEEETETYSGFEPSADDLEEDPKAIERSFKRIIKDWPGFGGMPREQAEKAWTALTAAERAEAERKYPGWLALLRSQRKSHTPGPASYFKGRLWRDVAEPTAAPAATVILAKPFGPDWSAARMVHLLRGAKGPAPTLSPLERGLVAQGKHTAEEYLAPKRRDLGWPDVNAMHQRAESRQPVSIPAEMTAPHEAMEPVQLGTPRFEAWRRLHEERGWPWIPDPGVLPVVWFPRGGPEALRSFETVMRPALGGSHAGD